MPYIPRLTLAERVDYLFGIASRLERENILAMSKITDLSAALTNLETVSTSALAELKSSNAALAVALADTAENSPEVEAATARVAAVTAALTAALPAPAPTVAIATEAEASTAGLAAVAAAVTQ